MDRRLTGYSILHVGGQGGGLEEGRRRQTGATGETLVAAGSGRIDSGGFGRGAARPGLGKLEEVAREVFT